MSKLINPWGEGGEAWDQITIAGLTFKGRVTVTGTPWKKKKDKRSHRGHNGRRDVATGWDLGEWTIEFTAWEDDHIEMLGLIIDAMTGQGPATQDTHAIPVSHPQFALKGVTQVTFDDGDALEPDPVGKITWKCKVTEFRPPEARPVTRAPAAAPQRTVPRTAANTALYVPHAGIVTLPEQGDIYVPTTPLAPTADP